MLLGSPPEYTYTQAQTDTHGQIQAHTGTDKHTPAKTGTHNTHRHTRANTGTHRHTRANTGTHRHRQAHTGKYRHTQHTQAHTGKYRHTQHTHRHTRANTGTDRHTHNITQQTHIPHLRSAQQGHTLVQYVTHSAMQMESNQHCTVSMRETPAQVCRVCWHCWDDRGASRKGHSHKVHSTACLLRRGLHPVTPTLIVSIPI